jgi:hypothetical protein
MQPTPPRNEARLSRIVIVVMYAVALGIPFLGAAIILVTARVGDRLSRISAGPKLAELRRHGWIAGLGGLAFWFVAMMAEDWWKSRARAEERSLPPVAVAFESACKTPLTPARRATIQGWLVIPAYPGEPDPCGGGTRCTLDLLSSPPAAARVATSVHVDLAAGEGPGQLQFTGSKYLAHADDGSPVGARRVTVTGTRSDDFKGGGCTFRVDELAAAPAR